MTKISKRLNYKECREKVFKLIEKSNTLSKQEIWNIIGLGHNMDYIYDYWKLPAFLKHTRYYAVGEYFKAKNKMVPTSNAISLNIILSEEYGTVREFLQFCEIERIPLLYYVHQIKEYIFPNEHLYFPIVNRIVLIMMRCFIGSLKQGESFGFWTSTNDVIEFFSKNTKLFEDKNEAGSYVISFIRKNYIYGESQDQMLKRLRYTEQLNELNEEIDKNIYSVIDLEIYDG